MATTAQILANRQNAQLSTGPSTPAGKAASSHNATRHGLSGAAATVLPHEDKSDYEALAASITGEFRPQGEHENFLVHQMVQARWKLARIERLEQLAFEQLLTEPAGDPDPDARILAAMSASGSPLDKLQRYQAAAERSYYKAHRELIQARKTAVQIKAKSLDAAFLDYLNFGLPGGSQNEPKGSAAPNQTPSAVRPGLTAAPPARGIR